MVDLYLAWSLKLALLSSSLGPSQDMSFFGFKINLLPSHEAHSVHRALIVMVYIDL